MPPPPRRSSSAARLSCASGGSNAGRSPTAWRKPASASSPSLDCRSANGDRHERPTPSSACTRSSSAGSRRRPCCHRPRRRPCCSGRCWHPARSRCARATAGRPWPSPPRRSRLTSPPDPTTLPAPETTLSQFQPHPRRHRRRRGPRRRPGRHRDPARDARGGRGEPGGGRGGADPGGPGRAGGGQDPMWAVSGGLTRSKMSASNQGAEDRKMSAGREAVAAVPGAAPAVFLAIELSKASWIVALHSPAGARVSLHRLPAGDARALLAFAEKARAAAAEATGEAVAVASCYEAGYDGFWLHRVLVAAGIANLVVDPVSLQVDRRARRAKTDRIDAQALLRALMAHHRHEPRVWSPVRVPAPADEDARRTHRERQNLLKERGRHVNRIKGLCAQQGIQGYEPIRRDRHER